MRGLMVNSWGELKLPETTHLCHPEPDEGSRYGASHQIEGSLLRSFGYTRIACSAQDDNFEDGGSGHQPGLSLLHRQYRRLPVKQLPAVLAADVTVPVTSSV